MPCSRQKLLRLSGRVGLHPKMVWTPEADGMVAPPEVSFLAATELRRLSRRCVINLIGGVLLTLTMLVLLFRYSEVYFDTGIPTGAQWLFRLGWLFYPLACAVVPVAIGMEGLRRLRDDRMGVLSDEAVWLRFRAWVRRRIPAMSWYIALCLFVVFIFQFRMASREGFREGYGRSIVSAGMLRVRVADGEYWRLLTSLMLHIAPWHLFGNLLVLLVLGRRIEALTHAMYVPYLFFTCALAGGAASLCFSPMPDGVGASGGVFGLLGFIVAMWLRRRRSRPPRLLRSLLWLVLLIGHGIVLSPFMMAHAVHLGGFAMGLLLGLVSLHGPSAAWPVRRDRVVVAIGAAFVVVILGVALLAVWKMHQPVVLPSTCFIEPRV